MKRTIFSAIILTVFIAAAGFIFSPGEPSAKEVMLPDHICVYLNGVPVTGALVTIGPYSGTTASDGCASFNISSGTYCVHASYNGYSACGIKVFTGGVDEMSLNLSKASCDCPDW